MCVYVCVRKWKKAREWERDSEKEARLELFVSETAANLSKKKHVRPLCPLLGWHGERWVNRPPAVYDVGGILRGSNSESYLHNITTVTFPRHFFVLRPFFFAWLLCIYVYNNTITQESIKNKHSSPPLQTHTHTKSPSASFLTCKMTWKLNPRGGGVAQWLLSSVYIKLLLFFIFILYVSDVSDLTGPRFHTFFVVFFIFLFIYFRLHAVILLLI